MRQLLKIGALYGIAEAIKKISPFLLLPLYLYCLTPGEFGRLEYITLVSTLLTLLVGWGGGTGLLRFYFSGGDSKEFVFLTLLLNALLMIVIGIGFFIFPIYFLVDMQSNSLMYICLLYAWLFSVVNVGVAILRAEERIKAYIFLNLFIVFVQLLAISLSLLYFKLSFEAKVIGNLVSYFLTAVIVFFVVIKNKMTIRIRRENLVSLLKFYSPIAGGGVSGWFSGSIDKIVVMNLLGETALGLYSLVIQLAQIFKLGVESFLKAFAVQYFKDSSVRSYIAKQEAKLVAIIGLLGLAYLLVCSLFIDLLLPVEYDVPILLFSLALSSRVILVLNYVEAIKVYQNIRSLPVFFINTFGGGINFLALYILIPLVGLLGAFISVCLSTGLMYIVYASTIRLQAYRMLRIVVIILVFTAFATLLE